MSSQQVDREAQFLASQKDRLDKLQESQKLDVHLQNQRKEFWQSFKQQTQSIQQSLSLLIGQESGKEFVTAQQRNEALEDLNRIQIQIKSLNHYCNRSNKFQKQILTEWFDQNELPELPIGDVRLVNVDLQELKTRVDEIRSIIVPREKFRFKRYHAYMAKHNANGVIIEEMEDDEEKLDSNEQEENEHDDMMSFDGLTLSKQADSVIVVEADGSIQIQNKEDKSQVQRISCEKTFTDAKAFLIQEISNCEIQVHGLYNSVHVIQAENSNVKITSAIHGPVHVTNCTNTLLQIPFSRQLRIHDCTSVSFVIHCASGPIIEGSKEMKFYQKDFEKKYSEDFDAGVNLYWDVKDFFWLKNNIKSPNFEVYTAKEFGEDNEVKRLIQSFDNFFLSESNIEEENSSGVKRSGEEQNIGMDVINTDGNDDEDDSSEDEL